MDKEKIIKMENTIKSFGVKPEDVYAFLSHAEETYKSGRDVFNFLESIRLTMKGDDYFSRVITAILYLGLPLMINEKDKRMEQEEKNKEVWGENRQDPITDLLNAFKEHGFPTENLDTTKLKSFKVKANRPLSKEDVIKIAKEKNINPIEVLSEIHDCNSCNIQYTCDIKEDMLKMKKDLQAVIKEEFKVNEKDINHVH